MLVSPLNRGNQQRSVLAGPRPEVDAAVDGYAQNTERLIAIARRTEDVVTCQLHGAIAQAMDLPRSDGERPRGSYVAGDEVTVSSIYFLATAQVTYGGAEARGTALLAREGAGWPAIVWRKLP